MSVESINEDVLLLTDDGPRLRGCRCADCGNYMFPVQTGCSRCAGTNIEEVLLGTRGELWAWTIQGFPPASPPYMGPTEPFEPYGVGYVTLPGQLKVETRLTESDPKRLRTGMAMELTTVALGEEDGRQIVTFAFAPAA